MLCWCGRWWLRFFVYRYVVWFMRTVALVWCLVAAVWSASAQSLADRQLDSLAACGVFVFVDGRAVDGEADSLRRVMDRFYYDQFRHSQDPASPYFMFISRDAQLAMGVGGCVRMRGWYEWGGVVPINGFSPYAIDIDGDRGRRLGTTPSGTALFFRVIGRSGYLGDYQLYVEANFDGYGGRDFHLKKAYVAVGEWTIGYANSTLSDPMAVPPTVDASGPNNKVAPTSVLVRRQFDGGRGWRMALSAETPSVAVDLTGGTAEASGGTADLTGEAADASGGTASSSGSGIAAASGRAADGASAVGKADGWLPDVGGFVQYGWGRSEHVRLSGILRWLPYRDLTCGRLNTVVGWGAQLSVTAHPWSAWTVYGTLTGGRGIGSMMGDFQLGCYDLVCVPGAAGRMYAPELLGWNAALQYNFTPSVFATLVYSEARYLPRYDVGGSTYRWGRYFAANVFWNLTPRVQVGAELNLGERKNMNGEHRGARRVGAMCQFSF